MGCGWTIDECYISGAGKYNLWGVVITNIQHMAVANLFLFCANTEHQQQVHGMGQLVSFFSGCGVSPLLTGCRSNVGLDSVRCKRFRVDAEHERSIRSDFAGYV